MKELSMAPPKSRFEAKPAATPSVVTPEPTVSEPSPVTSGLESEPAPAAPQAPEIVDVVPDVVETSAQIAAPVEEVVETAVEHSNVLAEEVVEHSKALAEETVEAVEEVATKTPAGLSALGLKAVENACVNASAYLDHVNDLIGAKSIPDVIELNTAFARKIAETLTAQAREFGEIAQKTASDAAGSMKTRFERVFKHAA